MKITLHGLIICLLFGYSCNSNNNCIIIKQVDTNLITPIRINCEYFDSAFNSQIEISKYCNNNIISQYQVIQNTLIEDTSNIEGDIRTEIIILSEKNIFDTLYISYSPKIMYLNNIKIKFNRKVLNNLTKFAKQ